MTILLDSWLSVFRSVCFLFIRFQIRLFPIYQFSDPSFCVNRASNAFCAMTILLDTWLSVFRSLFLCKSSCILCNDHIIGFLIISFQIRLFPIYQFSDPSFCVNRASNAFCAMTILLDSWLSVFRSVCFLFIRFQIRLFPIYQFSDPSFCVNRASNAFCAMTILLDSWLSVFRSVCAILFISFQIRLFPIYSFQILFLCSSK